MQTTKAKSDGFWALGRVALCAWASLFLWAPANAAQENAAQENAAQENVTQEASAEETTAEESKEADTVEEDDYEWVMDENRGRRYRIERLPKVKGTFRRVSETDVRFPGGATFEAVDEDEEWFYVKVYERIPRDMPVPKPEGPSAEKQAAVDAKYDTEYKTTDRLKLEPFDEGLPRTGQWRNGFAVADMNKDGHLDIVFGPARKGSQRPNIFLGDSAGKWRRWTEVRYPPAPYDYGDVAVGDVDGDGRLDMVFGIHLRGMLVLRSNGENSFEVYSEGVELDMPGRGGDATSFSSRALKLVDWDGDGKLDIVALGEGPKGLKTQKSKRGGSRLINTSRGFLVYLNNGDGSWKIHAQERGDNQRANFGDDFAIGDLDGDGHWDLLTATRQLGSRYILAETDDDSITYRQVAEVRPKAFIDAVEMVDLNADGRQDMVLSYRNRELETWRSGIDVLYGEEGGKYRSEALYSVDGRTSFGTIAVGRLDGDERLDLVVGNDEGALLVFLAEKEGGFSLDLSPELDQKKDGCQSYGVTLVDLDGDSRDEVVVGFAGEPTGYPGFPGLSKPGCVREGSLRVWKVAAEG